MSVETLVEDPPRVIDDPSPLVESLPPVEPSLLEVRHRLTVAQYERLAETGIFDRHPVELLEGVLVGKMTKKPPHIIATELVVLLFPRLVPAGWFVSMQNPVSIPEDDSEPEPDCQIVRGAPRNYADRKHGPADAAFVLEIAESSYAYDRGLKYRAYARARVPLYAILDLNRRVLEVFTEPTGEGDRAFYRAARTYTAEEEVPLVLDGREVGRFPLRDILP